MKVETTQEPTSSAKPSWSASSILRLLLTSDFQRRGAMVAAGTLIAQAAQAVGTPFLARLYSPSTFGLWSLVQSAAGIPAALGGLRYELAIVLSETDEDAANLAALQALSTLAVSAVTFFVILFFSRQAAVVFGAPGLNLWLFLVPFMVMLNGLSASASYWMVRFKQFHMLAGFRIVLAVAGVGAPCGLALLFGGRPACLIAGGVFGLFSPLFLWYPKLTRDHSGLFRHHVSRIQMWRLARKFINFPRYVVPFGFVATVRERGIVMLLGAFVGLQAAGLYTMALRLVFVPVQLVASSLSPVIFQSLSERQSDPGLLVSQVTRRIGMLATPGFVFLGWYARDLIVFLLGSRWADAGRWAPILVVAAALQVLTGPFERFFDVIRKQHVALLLESLYSVATLAVVGVSLALGSTVSMALFLFACVSAAYNVGWLWQIYRNCECGTSALWGLVARTITQVVVCLGILWGGSQISSGYTNIALATMCLLAYYVAQIMRYLKDRRVGDDNSSV